MLRRQNVIATLRATSTRRGARALGVALGLSILTGIAGGTEPGTNEVRPLIQFGLFQKENEAWISWTNVQRKAPDIAAKLTPLVGPSDPARPANGIALRADAPKDTDLNALCRRLVGAGLGCLVVTAPARAAPGASGAPVTRTAVPATPAAVAAAGKPPVPPAAGATRAPTSAASIAATAEQTSQAAAVAAAAPQQTGAVPAVAGAAAPSALSVALVPGTRPAPLVPMASTAQQAAVVAPTQASAQAQPAISVAAATAATAAIDREQRSVASTLALVVPAAPLPVAVSSAAAQAVLAKPAPAEVISYSEEDSRVMAEIDRRNRRQGRLGAVLPDRRLDVTPAVLAQPEMNYCALTFDDGPHRVATRQILDILNAEKIVATYFPVGKVAIRYGDLIREFVASGHEIGNHSLTHSDLRTLKPEEQRFEIAETNRILREFGANPILFRPPYGRYNASLIAAIHAEGMEAVLWNVDTRDWKVRDPDKIVSHVRTAAGTGSVLLMHSTFTSTATALPAVISDLRSKRCRFVTLSQWISGFQQAAMVTPIASAAVARP